jgi:hypothetical protein
MRTDVCANCPYDDCKDICAVLKSSQRVRAKNPIARFYEGDRAFIICAGCGEKTEVGNARNKRRCDPCQKAHARAPRRKG